MDSATQESNMKLIREIGKRPCLYNKTLISYNRKSLQDKAWEEVGKCMGWKVSFCKDKWRNLRSVYIRHVRQVKEGVSKRPYYLMDAMRFALPFIQPLKKRQTIPTESYEVNENEESDGNNTQNEQKFDIRKSIESSSSMQLRMSSESPGPDHSFVTEYIPSPVSHIKNEDITQVSDAEDVLMTSNPNDVHVEISDVSLNLDLQNDAKKMFLLSLLPDVYAMSDVQMRTFKQGVLNIIGNIFDSGN